MTKRKVAILVPSHSGHVHCNFALSMAEIFRVAASEHPNLDLSLRFLMYDPLVQKARNDLFAQAMEDNVDDIVFIDGDQAFSAGIFFRVLAHPVDVVGVPVRMKSMDERYNLRPEDPSLHTYNPELRLLQITNIGTGFLRLSRKAMQALWDRSTEYRDVDNKVRRMIGNFEVVNGGICSEDVQICTKLRASGFKIFADISETCSHFGTKGFSGDYRKYYLGNYVKSFAA